MTLQYPNYNDSILNITSSILRFYDASTPHKSLSAIDVCLTDATKNVVLIVMDGMGTDVLAHHLDREDFLRKHMVKSITSVYPCTTTAAMNTYYSGQPPIEHGWLGWSLYFKEYGRFVDAFVNVDSFSKESIGDTSVAKSILPIETVFDKVRKSSKEDLKTYTVNPEGIETTDAPNTNYASENLKDFSNNLIKAMNQDGSKYIMGYWYEPDLTMHKTGCFSDATGEVIRGINRRLTYIAENAPKDTVIIISADHGLTDIDETLYINDYPELMSCLIMPPSIEPRCLSLFVKSDKKEHFETKFKALFEDDFMLLSKEDFLSKNLLGTGKIHPKVDDFLGDYIAIGLSQKLLKYRAENLAVDHDFKAHHAGLRHEEMTVPLIIYTT